MSLLENNKNYKKMSLLENNKNYKKSKNEIKK